MRARRRRPGGTPVLRYPPPPPPRPRSGPVQPAGRSPIQPPASPPDPPSSRRELAPSTAPPGAHTHARRTPFPPGVEGMAHASRASVVMSGHPPDGVDASHPSQASPWPPASSPTSHCPDSGQPTTRRHHAIRRVGAGRIRPSRHLPRAHTHAGAGAAGGHPSPRLACL